MTAVTGDSNRTGRLAGTTVGGQAVVNKDHTGKHTYWRLFITANNGDTGRTEVSSLKLYNEVGGPNIAVNTTNGIPFASSENTQNGFKVGMAFDEDDWSEWTTDYEKHIPSFVGYIFDEPQDIIAFTLGTTGTYGADAVPTVFELQYSDDNINWYSKISGTTTNIPPLNTIGTWSFFYGGGIAGSGTLTLPTCSGEILNSAAYTAEAGFDIGLFLPSAEIDGYILAPVDSPLPALTASGSGLSGEVSSPYDPPIKLPSLGVTSTHIYADAMTGAAVLPTLSAAGQTPGLASVTLPRLEIAAQGATGWLSQGKIRLPKLKLSAGGAGTGESGDRALTANISTPALAISAELAPGNNASLSIELKSLILAAAGVTGTVTTSTVTLPLLDLSSDGYPEYIGTATLTLPLLQLQATGRGAFGEPDTDNPQVTISAYALNTRTKSLTEFTNYGFNSFTEFNGQFLAASDNGVFAMSGDTDNGVPIDALARLPVTDFRELEAEGFAPDHIKRVVEAYVGYRTDGDLVLKVMVDEDGGYEYSLKATGWQGIHNNRVKFRKGLKGRYWQLEVRNVSGADFELESLEAMVTSLSRRLR